MVRVKRRYHCRETIDREAEAGASFGIPCQYARNKRRNLLAMTKACQPISGIYHRKTRRAQKWKKFSSSVQFELQNPKLFR
ncbi:MAG: hypothetical protein AYP45_02910 [Candidatus Brocadia carolinensis]|uniref:Uncharacterized protein n=1 Tax=Candidatus Brocadia carolinensis TaxID=1004156 RepID=A0A1V4AWJ8_9BACT|nr:MAG: hypothetical protein AYP45_02910 [Candidatus Brocadia caroliniensis]